MYVSVEERLKQEIPDIKEVILLHKLM